MASTARLILHNAIYDSSVAMKNGTAGAPAINEDPEFPMANLTIPARYRFWRSLSSNPNPTTINVDFVLPFSIPIIFVGVGMIRAYRGGAGITQVQVQSASGTTYPPGSWTVRSTLSIASATDNDRFADISSVTSKLWRFAITGASQWSCQPWLVRSGSNYIASLAQGGPNVIENPKRIREREKVTFLGGRQFNDLGIGVAERIREFLVPLPLITDTILSQLRQSQSGEGFLYQHTDGNYYQVRHQEEDLTSERHPGPGTLHQSMLKLVQVP